MRAFALVLALYAATKAFAEPPRLVVVISVDQMRADYIARFDAFFGERGFHRFTAGGAVFPEARSTHGVTYTGPAHATISTGRPPSEHGIVGNYWFERNAAFDAAAWKFYVNDSTLFRAPNVIADPARSPWYQSIRGVPRYCVYDSATGVSPAALESEGLGDALKKQSASSRVISVALKDRAAVLLGGHSADTAYWFDHARGAFVSSEHYKSNPRALAFNSSVAGYIPASREWTPSIAIGELQKISFDPPAAWPLKNGRYKGTFPHPVTDARGVAYSPFGNDLLLDFTLHVAAAESLGSDDTPDILFVGLSSTDYFGHYYGPDSMEVADGMIRLDRSLARFFDTLERRIGVNIVVALTADHGVQRNPEIAKLQNPRADAGRLDLRNAVPEAITIADLPPQRIELEKRIASALRLRFSPATPLENAFVLFFEEPGLHLNWQKARAMKIDPERLKRAARDVARQLPGVSNAWTSSELRSMETPLSRTGQLMHASFRGDRSPDVVIALRPGWIWTWGSNSTSHGQPVDADLRVPLMFFGSGIHPGTYEMVASPGDLARTLGSLIGVEIGSGEVLPVSRSNELSDVIAVALRQINAPADVKLVAGRDLGRAARMAAASLGPLVESSDLPEGHVRIDRAEVSGNKAAVNIWTGPIPKAKPGEILLDCGKGHMFQLEKNTDGRWVVTGIGVSVC
ncbi:MAG: alkaline phosphatase family protein [Thermoanaerobaculia bacterium]|nr:alkaline phosphatase family protein [Thermoanaerobaculia bacterium]